MEGYEHDDHEALMITCCTTSAGFPHDAYFRDLRLVVLLARVGFDHIDHSPSNRITLQVFSRVSSRDISILLARLAQTVVMFSQPKAMLVISKPYHLACSTAFRLDFLHPAKVLQHVDLDSVTLRLSQKLELAAPLTRISDFS